MGQLWSRLGQTQYADLTPPYSSNVALCTVARMCAIWHWYMLKNGMVHAPCGCEGGAHGFARAGVDVTHIAATLCDVEERLFVTAKRGGCRVSSSRGEDVARLMVVAYRSGSEVEHLDVRR